MRDGPTTNAMSYRSCADCRWWDHRMIMSGMDPVYENHCMHPSIVEVELYTTPEGRCAYSGRSRSIGRDDHTPSWCPFLTGRAGIGGMR